MRADESPRPTWEFGQQCISRGAGAQHLRFPAARSYFAFLHLHRGDGPARLRQHQRRIHRARERCGQDPADKRHVVPGPNATISRECERRSGHVGALDDDRPARPIRQRRDDHADGILHSAGNSALARKRHGDSYQQRGSTSVGIGDGYATRRHRCARLAHADFCSRRRRSSV